VDGQTSWLWKERGGKSGNCVVSQDPRSEAPPRPVPQGRRLPPYSSLHPVPTGRWRLRSFGRIQGWGAYPHSHHCHQWFLGVCVGLPPESCPSSSHVCSLSVHREAHCRFSRGIVVVLPCEVLFQLSRREGEDSCLHSLTGLILGWRGVPFTGFTLSRTSFCCV
jgi:hypothetical protein